jgi:S1-C subfamily serine protease
VTTVDWIALAFVAVTGLLGLKKGLIASALSLAGIVAGAIVGARLAPQLLTGGSASPYTPLAGLGGAAVGALLLETIGAMAGRTLRGSLPVRPLLALDSLGGLVLGAAAGLALIWVVGASALLVPGQTALRRGAQQSLILRQLYERVPPARFMRLLARVDPFPAIVGPNSPVEPPDPALLRSPGVRHALPSVVRVLGTACGLRIAGSGWVAKPSLVVTAAHVVAGQKDTVVEKPGSDQRFKVTVVALDALNDIAVLRVRGLGLRALPTATPKVGMAVAILGYPENGPLKAVPGRLGPTTVVLSQDAYGHGPVPRRITAVRGNVRHGDSGGPAVDRRGAVEATLFAARLGSEGGFGVPSDIVQSMLRHVRRPAVSTGTCSA